jgi:hypothetical protein
LLISLLNKINLYYETLKYLKFKQFYFRFFYFFRDRYRKKIQFTYPSYSNITSFNLTLEISIYNYHSYLGGNHFEFLNLNEHFSNNIDWNYTAFGKLWTYNITYFDFLNQKNINKEESLNLINDFISKEHILQDGLEAFPISIRAINWIKFLTYNQINDDKINNILYKHYQILLDKLEYHVLGNHLLENGFSLLFGSYYFENDELYSKAKTILNNELNEQVLEDGGHFELSPMYHQLMLFRILDCINLIKNNSYKRQELLSLLTEKASIMLGWLKNMTFESGDIPLFNDSSNNIAPKSKDLFYYAKSLNVQLNLKKLNSSGYRKYSNEYYECIIDVGNIGPDYIPGHAHSDTFNFELYVNKKAFIVDTGLSTYQINNRRVLERSTFSHNTVEVNNKEQSKIWSGFRVANRAKIINLVEVKNSISSSHDGYKKDGIIHKREWEFKDKSIVIRDSLNKDAFSIARLHFHPEILENEILEKLICTEKIKVSKYKYASQFNILDDALMIEIEFKKNLKLEIKV